MRNLVQEGNTVTLAAPSGGVSSGDPFAVGGIFAVASYDAVQGDPVEGRRNGVFDLPKTTGETWSVGERLYFDTVTKKLTTTEGSNLFVGAALLAAGSSDETGRALLAATIAPTPASPPPPPPPGP